MKYLVVIYLFISLLKASTTFAQFKLVHPKIETNQEIPGSVVTAGLNAPLFYNIDLNNDKIADLLAFDKYNDKFYTWIRKDSNWIYNPSYENSLPSCSDWCIVHDFNKDNLPDIFTSSALGITVWKNNGYVNNVLFFEKKQDFITAKGFSSTIIINVNSFDLPYFGDIDFDSDMDILAVDPTTGSKIELFKNISSEHNKPLDSLLFQKEDVCWGGFEEVTCTEFKFGKNCEVVRRTGNERIKHTGSATIWCNPSAETKIPSMIFSKEFCDSLTLFKTKNQLNFKFDTYQRINSEGQFIVNPVLNAISFVELDGKSPKELLVTPYIESNPSARINLYNSIQAFHIKGAEFSNAKIPLFQDTLLDMGEFSSPALVDVDADNDLDLIVGNRGKWQGAKFASSLYLYENIGTKELPDFKLKTTDYLSLYAKNFSYINPIFEDLNNDGKKDLILVSTFLAQGSQSNIKYLFCNSNSNKLEYDIEKMEILPIPINIFDKPYFIDVDSNGIKDVLLCKSNGELIYWKGLENMKYQFSKLSFLGIKSSLFTKFLDIAIVGSKENQTLFRIDNSGYLKKYTQIDFSKSVSETDSLLVYNELSNQFEKYFHGRVPRLASGDLNNDGEIDLVLGSNNGGLSFLLSTSSILENKKWLNSVVLKSDQLAINTNTDTEVYVYNLLGQIYLYKSISKGIFNYPLNNLSAGVYIISLVNKITNERVTKKYFYEN